VKRLKLLGGYAENPEENGQVLQAVRRKVGMETSLGSVLLNGGYTLEDRMGGLGFRTTEFGFGLNLWRTTQLKATYSLVDGYGEGNGDSALYGLHFSHDLGDRFTLSLDGQASDKRGFTPDDERLYSGSAKLGMKF
jgi:hypothetical protein